MSHPRRRLTLIWEHPIVLEDVLNAITRQANEGAWAYGVLGDLRGLLSLPDVAVPVAAYVTELVTIYGPRGPVALVSSTTALGSVEKYTQLHGQRIQAFWDMGEAERWLNALDPPTGDGSATP